MLPSSRQSLMKCRPAGAFACVDVVGEVTVAVADEAHGVGSPLVVEHTLDALLMLLSWSFHELA